MEQGNRKSSTRKSVTESASRSGLFVGAMWIASFVCSMYSLRNPICGYVGNTIALLSVFALYMVVVRYRVFVGPLRFGGCWRLSWLTCVFAGLLTTLAQYLYFRFLDGGRMLESISLLFENDQYKQALEQMMPGVKSEEMLRMLQSVSIGDLTIQMWLFNLFISLPLSLVAALFGTLKNIDHLQKRDGQA